MLQEAKVPCELMAQGKGEFVRLARLSDLCSHIRVAEPPPLSRSGAGGFVDALSLVDWPCTTSATCSKSGTSQLVVVCKQRPSGPRELDKPVYLHFRVESLTPRLVRPVDDKGQAVSTFVLGPKMLVATPRREDHDTQEFRVVVKVPLWTENVDEETFAKLQISVIGRYDKNSPRSWGFASVRKTVLPVKIGQSDSEYHETNCESILTAPTPSDQALSYDTVLQRIELAYAFAAQTVDPEECVELHAMTCECKNKVGPATPLDVLQEVLEVIEDDKVRPRDTILGICSRLGVSDPGGNTC